MPNDTRIALVLIAGLLTLLAFVPDSSRALRLLRSETLPRLKEAKNDHPFEPEIDNEEWTRLWVPASMKQSPAPALSQGDATPVSEAVPNLRDLQVGLRWFYYLRVYHATALAFVMAISAYFIARPFARRLTPPVASLILSLALVLMLYYLEGSSQLVIPHDMGELRTYPIRGVSLAAHIWAGPLAVIAGVTLSALLPFASDDSAPRYRVRFFALWRAVNFFFFAFLLGQLLWLAIQFN